MAISSGYCCECGSELCEPEDFGGICGACRPCAVFQDPRRGDYTWQYENCPAPVPLAIHQPKAKRRADG